MYVIDMLKIARKCFSIPGRRYTLSNVADFLGIERKNEHRALSDAKTALEVFDKAYPLLKQKKIDNVEDIAVPCGEIINKDLHRNKPFLDILHKAMREQRPVFIHYRSKWSDNSTKRAITPISINGKYLHSYCHLRGEKRTFLIECIENAADIKK
jgi:predicted DNA-binding transcriptional regulator YafY